MPPGSRKCVQCQSIQPGSSFSRHHSDTSTASSSKARYPQRPSIYPKPKEISSPGLDVCEQCRSSKAGVVKQEADEAEERFMRCIDCCKIRPKTHFNNDFTNEGNVALFGESCSACRGIKEDSQTPEGKSGDLEPIPLTITRKCKRCERSLPETCFWVGISAQPWNSAMPCRLCISCRLMDDAQSTLAEPQYVKTLALDKLCTTCQQQRPTMDYIKAPVEISDEGDVVQVPSCVGCRFEAHKSEHEKAKHPRDSAKLLYLKEKPRRTLLPLRSKRVVSAPLESRSSLDFTMMAASSSPPNPVKAPIRRTKRSGRAAIFTQSNETCILCGNEGWEEADADVVPEVPVCPDCRDLDRTSGLGLRPRQTKRRKT
ncbi:MAG: hypothetical protein M1814_004962 [Vezdaea aestivalis]|nr:MAG: hypothetical protein M1814_004962 [Vezdaea aestivalis]